MQYANFQFFSELTAALYNGPFETPRWDGFLRLLGQECQANIMVLGLTRPDSTDPDGVVFWATDDAATKVSHGYGAHAKYDDFVNLPPGKAVTLREYLPQEEWEGSSIYRDWFVPQNIGFMLGIDIYQDDQVAMYIRLTRGVNENDFGELEKSLLDSLYPHFESLLLWLNRQEELNSQRSIYESVVGHLALGTFIIDDLGNVEKMNPVAEFLLESAEELYVDQGRLVCRSPGLNRTLKQLISSPRESNNPRLIDSMTVPRVNAEKPLYLTIKRRVSSEFSSDKISAHNILFINAPEIHVTGSLDALREMFGLTHAEASLAIELVNGLSVGEIAEKRHLSINTIRTHVTRIYRKTDVNKQTALVSMLLRCIASLNSPADETQSRGPDSG